MRKLFELDRIKSAVKELRTQLLPGQWFLFRLSVEAYLFSLLTAAARSVWELYCGTIQLASGYAGYELFFLFLVPIIGLLMIKLPRNGRFKLLHDVKGSRGDYSAHALIVYILPWIAFFGLVVEPLLRELVRRLWLGEGLGSLVNLAAIDVNVSCVWGFLIAIALESARWVFRKVTRH